MFVNYIKKSYNNSVTTIDKFFDSYNIYEKEVIKDIEVSFYEKVNELDYLSQEEKQQIIDIVNKTGSCQDIKSLQNLIGDTFRLGNEISYQDHLKVVGIAQKFIDDGISKTINLENNATKEEIDNAIRMAYDLNLKGISVFRDGCLDERNLESI